MKFGMFVLPSWPQPDPSHQGRIYHEMIEQIQYAEELGFESVWLAEHHFTRFGKSAFCLTTSHLCGGAYQEDTNWHWSECP
ncbi:MAG: hypothetical protein Ct9H300mP11_31230 [Chloroflexota bacterium]|nr:MAG: hypothetical protein Ct9H300mP11_31230 [Chloroflexota bacterium]